MNDVVLQIWEESDIEQGITQDGCSLHIDMNHRNKYIDSYYSSIVSDKTPEKYERAVGRPVEVFVTEKLLNIVKSEGSVRLMQNELSNLIDLYDIIILD